MANEIDVTMVKLDAVDLKDIQVPMDVYRMVLPWLKPLLTPTKPCPAPPTPTRGRFVAITALRILLTSVGIWFLTHKRIHTSGPIRSLAELPLDNLSGETNMDYIVEGLTEENRQTA